ncbi:MAG: cell division ATP-binding protein FtsE [Alphaproteobacteria bacterium]
MMRIAPKPPNAKRDESLKSTSNNAPNHPADQASAPDPVAKLERVGLRYGSGPEILHDISLTLNPGAFYFLTGESGAGKSSLLRMLYLAHLPAKGRMKLFGKNVTQLNRKDLPLLRQRIGIVFQDFRLLDHLTVFENVALPLRLMGEERHNSEPYVMELLKWVGLLDYAEALPNILSGGQKQSAAIARAVIGRPQLLLADEPTGNLDDRLAQKLMKLFEELNRQGATVMIATHNHGLIRRMGHPIVHIEHGSLTQTKARLDGGHGKYEF